VHVILYVLYNTTIAISFLHLKFFL